MYLIASNYCLCFKRSGQLDISGKLYNSIKINKHFLLMFNNTKFPTSVIPLITVLEVLTNAPDKVNE